MRALCDASPFVLVTKPLYFSRIEKGDKVNRLVPHSLHWELFFINFKQYIRSFKIVSRIE